MKIQELRKLIDWNRHAGDSSLRPELRKMFVDTANALEELLAIKTSKEGLVN